MNRILTAFLILFFAFQSLGQTAKNATIYKPFVNQLGYNLGESKRFVCYNVADNTPFRIIDLNTNQTVFEGKMLNFQGWFSEFNPFESSDEFIVEVDGHGKSVPFFIGDHLMELKSSQLAYGFFIDARGSANLDEYDMTKVYGGGPTRDGGAYGLESIFEVLQYASNPALFDTWTKEMDDNQLSDLIELILWHAEFAYKYHEYNGVVKNRHGTLGYRGEPRMNYDYWNTLDQLAAVCAAYHSFLKPYLSEEKYQKYRKVCNEKWQEYDRHKVVRYWTYSTKWVDEGFQEFNEMGNAFGQSVFSNLFMYICEKNEADGQPEKYLAWAQESADDIIANWDFNNPRHMWWIRNAEHITPQSLAYFLMVEPDKAPAGTKEKLAAWAIHMKQKTNNFWQYRKHSETEWAHAKTKELGGAPALGGSMFAVAHLLNDPELRNIGWAQVDFVFGVNPVGAHLSNKSDERVAIGAYWPDIENGWPQSLAEGYGQLGKVRGTLDGTPLNSQFPIAKEIEFVDGKLDGQVFSNVAYATEGWGISNRGWQATLTFSTLGSQHVKIFDADYKNEITETKANQTIIIELKAALNKNTKSKDEAWVLVNGEKLKVVETDVNTGVFTTDYTVPIGVDKIKASYGFMGFEKQAAVHIVQ